MQPLLTVAPEDILDLTPIDLTALLKRLLHLEAQAYGLPCRGVHVPLNINVPDGGEDGRIKWSGAPSSTGYLPSRFTVFQCKASRLSRAECGAEVLNRDRTGVKRMVNEALSAGGSYIHFTTNSLNQQQVDDRIMAIRDALRKVCVAYVDEAGIEIYDANKIADWTNCFISAVVFVFGRTGRPIPRGLKTWDEWSQDREMNQPRLVKTDEFENLVASLRSVLASERCVSRIVGLPGLGKSRLAFEAVRPVTEITPEHALCHSVVYVDGREPHSGLVAAVSDWIRGELTGLLIVDNCPIELHNAIAREVRRDRSRLGLLTLDIEDETPTLHIPIVKLKPMKDEGIKQILKNAHPSLSDSDLSRLTELAQGFPQVAVLIGEARLRGAPDIASLRDDTLVKRLVWGRGGEDPEAYKVIEACAVFREIGFEGEVRQEAKFIAETICGSEIEAFHGKVKVFERRGIIESNGRFIRVRPHPLAVRLAGEWWNSCPPEMVQRLLSENLSDRLVDALCNRMRMLDFIPRARKLVQDLCGELGPFGNAEMLLSKRGSQLLRAMVEVNPEAVVNKLWRELSGVQCEELHEAVGARRNLVATLEKAVFRVETFQRASRLLLKLAVAENESWKNNATGTFLQLFHVFLSGTQAPPDLRLRLIDEVLDSVSEPERALGVQALSEALQARNYSRVGGPEQQGGGPPMVDWQPKHWGEVFDYWEEALSRLRVLIKGGGNQAESARAVIAERMAGVLRAPQMTEALDLAVRDVVEHMGSWWPSGLEAVTRIISALNKNLPADCLKQVEQWLELLSPAKMPHAEKLAAIISIPPWVRTVDDDGQRINMASENARTLAKEIAAKYDEWHPYLQNLFVGEQRQGFIFGAQLARNLADCSRILELAINSLKAAPEGTGNPDTLGGLLSVLQDKEPEIVTETLETAAKTPLLKRFLVDLTKSIMPSEEDLDRLVETLRFHGATRERLRILTCWSGLYELPPSVVGRFCLQLCDLGVESAWIGLEIFSGYCHNRKDENQNRRLRLLREILLHSNLVIGPRGTQHDLWTWEDCLERLFGEQDSELAQHVAKQIINGSRQDVGRYEIPSGVLRLLFSNHSEDVWPLFGAALVSSDSVEVFALQSLLGSGFDDNEDGRAISAMPDKLLLKWCEQAGDQGARILANIVQPVIEKEDAEDWSPLMRNLIDRYGTNRQVLVAIFANLITVSTWGSLVPHYKRLRCLFLKLVDHPTQEVREWAQEMADRMGRSAEEESQRDAEDSLGL